MANLNESFNLLVDKLSGWLDAIVLALPNLLLAILVMVIAGFAARYVRKYFQQLTRRFSKSESVVSLLSSIATVVFILLALFIVLNILNLSSAVTSLLAGAGVVGLAIGLALQDPLVNMFSGVIMSVRDMYNVGDLVETNGFFGNIQKISLRTTIIKLPTGQDVVIPNREVIQNPLTNYTLPGERRVELDCGVSYGDDLEKVKDLVIKTIEENIVFQEDRGIEFFFTEFGNSSINFRVRFWLDQVRQADFLRGRSEAIMAIKKAFDENDITIPFPIRTLDFGIKGGEKLNEVMSVREMSNGE